MRPCSAHLRACTGPTDDGIRQQLHTPSGVVRVRVVLLPLTEDALLWAKITDCRIIKRFVARQVAIVDEVAEWKFAPEATGKADGLVLP